MNINEKIEIILNNIKNKSYTSFDFQNKKRKFKEIGSLSQAPLDCSKSARNDIENSMDLEINYQDNKFYIIDKKLRKNVLCDDCPICYDKIKIIDKIMLQCKHIFCSLCHYNWEKTCFLGKKELSCPLCRKVSNISREHRFL